MRRSCTIATQETLVPKKKRTRHRRILASSIFEKVRFAEDVRESERERMDLKSSVPNMAE